MRRLPPAMTTTEAPPITFDPLARETISAQIRDQLLQRIVTGALAPGTRMPSERDLSEQFGVARTSVREAMQGLLSLGVIERRGNRSFVAERLPDVSFDARDNRRAFVRQLFETRRLLEVPIIELAAERAKPAERAEIREVADRFRPDMGVQAFRELDQEFHARLARACQNPLLVEVYGKVMARLFQSEDVAALLLRQANRDEVHKIIVEASAQHAAIARAVAAGDREAARREGAAHLASVEQGMIDRLV